MTIPTPIPDIHTIDAHYVQPGRMSVYLIIHEGRAAFVDNNTALSVPRLLQALDDHGLSPDAVDYAIVTHVHLDHAGGAAGLLEACPNATALVHPKTYRHLADPARLVAAARMIYQDRFDEIYGSVDPVPEDRMRIMNDGEVLNWNGRALTFFYTLGHASHHFCVHDAHAGIVFAGDNYGIAYPQLQGKDRPYLFPAATPTEFDPVESRKSIDAILSYDPSHAYLGHFGAFEANDETRSKLMRTIDGCEEIIINADNSGREDDALIQYVRERIEAFTREELQHSGLPVDDDTWSWVGPDTELNVHGLTAAVMNRRKAKAD